MSVNGDRRRCIPTGAFNALMQKGFRSAKVCLYEFQQSCVDPNRGAEPKGLPCLFDASPLRTRDVTTSRYAPDRRLGTRQCYKGVQNLLDGDKVARSNVESLKRRAGGEERFTVEGPGEIFNSKEERIHAVIYVE